ncbi:hypothetical protein U9M48_022087 [Paspalum notatum var. saurae]|uniref:Uncharacterized protein n=1 Tax=Paspalum notatum var. saurae TaxID=547442 RepID=A0AAQ3THM2_PASNO
MRRRPLRPAGATFGLEPKSGFPLVSSSSAAAPNPLLSSCIPAGPRAATPSSGGTDPARRPTLPGSPCISAASASERG